MPKLLFDPRSLDWQQLRTRKLLLLLSYSLVALLLASALLLLTPGFFTDALGFACLIPPVRRALALWLLGRFTVITPAGQGPRQGGGHQPTTIEGEFRREDENHRET